MQSIKDISKQKISGAAELLSKINAAKDEIAINFSQATLNKFQELFEKINIRIGLNPKKDTILNLLNLRKKKIEETLEGKKTEIGFFKRLIQGFKNRD